MPVLEFVHNGRLLRFGPFVGYYFRPEVPGEMRRIRLVCFNERNFYSSDAPAAWLESRPEPRDAYGHFHSCHDASGPVLTGFWIRHVAVRDFTYDMGGRVGPGSPLYHRVRKGEDRDFARIIEFDRGKGKP